MGYTKRKNGKWYFQETVNGKRVTTYIGSDMAKVEQERKQAQSRELVAVLETAPQSVDSTTIKRLLVEARRQKERASDRRSVAQVVPIPDGPFSAIIMDPPWDWGDEGDIDQLGRARPVYDTMTIEEIEDLPIVTRSAQNCHLYLWITNRSLPKGFRLFEAWGFRYITLLTWAKPFFGMGNYFRGQTEHIMFGVKGGLPLLRHDIGTVFSFPRGENHSAKPDELFRILATCSPEPRLEMFARTPHAGWLPWGNIDG